jgi:hypothetical protein
MLDLPLPLPLLHVAARL